ncbi:RNA polymerase sigma factor [Urechidicola vernalis]|uniref:RNA polymerase sigma factor n=1 Tax=Urechidicola vernalis TaxID=3075600 RepID=A0ABU2Y6T2_9FLAO|nr:RNA polymerase sigma factor [Urechidicola sp. P050]MDT0553906.1 RNA polymerase sigma factor [Urechidicola sp. P050]
MSENDNYKKLKSFFSSEYTILKRYVNSRISDSVDREAEDIIQDVALKLFSRAHSLSPINNVTGFVYNALRNKVIDTMRINKKHTSIEDSNKERIDSLLEVFYGEASNAYSEKMKHELMRMIYKLKPHYSAIILAIDFEGYSYKDLANETGIPQGTLMSRRHRALSILYKELEKNKI